MKTTLITTFAIAVTVFAFNTNPAMAGGNSDTQHTLWSSNQQEVDELKDLDETDVARYQPDFEWKWRQDPGTGNYGWVKEYMNESNETAQQVAIDSTSGDDDSWLRWIPPSWFLNEDEIGEVGESELAGLTRRQKQQQDEDDWNAWILKQFAGLRPEQRQHFKDENDWSAWVKMQFAGMTRRQKQQQDEDDWNAWILQQFAGLTRRQKQQQDEDDWNAWILKQFALPYTPADECDPYTAGAYCPAGNEDEGAAEQREFAAGAQGGSFSAAGLTLGGLPTEADGTAAATEDSLNDRVLRSGHY